MQKMHAPCDCDLRAAARAGTYGYALRSYHATAHSHFSCPASCLAMVASPAAARGEPESTSIAYSCITTLTPAYTHGEPPSGLASTSTLPIARNELDPYRHAVARAQDDRPSADRERLQPSVAVADRMLCPSAQALGDFAPLVPELFD